MTLRLRRSLATATTLVFLAGSAQATTITINDTSASDLVIVSWTGGLAGGLTSIGIVGSRCSEVGLGPVSLDAGTVICSETSPLVVTIFANANLGEGNHIVHANFWEDRVSGELSDTASLVGTQLTPTTVEDV